MSVLRGITWDHPRAYRPLEAFQASDPTAPAVVWDRQPLAGFEAHPIADLAKRYDLIILDHPGLGSAVAEDALHPLEGLFGTNELATWAADSIGPTWQSYQYRGHQWALPVDASTQVSVLRTDLIDEAPTCWADVLALPDQVRISLCLGGPHALLHLLGMCASVQQQPDHLLAEPTATDAVALLQRLWRRCDQSTSLLDPISVHEALATSDDLAYCPLAYGYALYGRPETGRMALSWANAPTWFAGRPGTVLGGTGLAVSSHSAAHPQVATWIRTFMAPEIQNLLVPDSGGQPAHRRTWMSSDTNGYYSSTVASMLAAWIRPRGPGWIPFQQRASEIVRACVTTGSDPAPVVSEINKLFTKAGQ